MEIKTKFNLGDTIVAIKNHKFFEFKITHISISSYFYHGVANLSIDYSGEKTGFFYEKDCFASREEYINQLSEKQE